MRSLIKINGKNFFNNLDYYLKNSSNDNWYFYLLDAKKENKEQLINNFEKIKKCKKTIMYTLDKEDIIRCRPYCTYIKSNHGVEKSIEILKAAQDVMSKIVVGLDFDRTSKEDILKIYDEFNKVDNSIIYTIINEKSHWEDVINFVKSLKDINLDKTIFLDIMPCLATKFNVKHANHSLNEVTEIIEDNINNQCSFEYVKDFMKTSKEKDCNFFHNCFGKLKASPDIPIKQEHINDYCSIDNMVRNSTNVGYGVKKCNPRNVFDLEKEPLIGPIVDILQDCRVNNYMEHRNFFYIWDWQESVFFNRPLEGGPVWKEDPRGLMSMNWKFIAAADPKLQWKQKCDCLLPSHGLVTCSKIKFDEEWTEKKRQQLNQLTMDSLKRTVLENGGDSSKLEHIGNDLFYNGKKWSGKEWRFIPNYGYIENTLVTCDYIAEKKWFDQIYHYEGEHPITGITNEVPSITKELLLDNLYKDIKKFFDYF